MSNERELAYIETITDIQPIEGADMIDVATILGWKVIVKKGQYQVGEKVVYCEIDSIMPQWQYFIDDKLGSRSNFRIKTAKLRGQVSQGYVFPLKVLEQNPDIDITVTDKEIRINPSVKWDSGNPVDPEVVEGVSKLKIKNGLALTRLIGIKKYERFVEGDTGESRSNFPAFLERSKQTRIQNKPQLIELFGDMEFEVTEKLEGTSITVYNNNGKQGICTRRNELVNYHVVLNLIPFTKIGIRVHYNKVPTLPSWVKKLWNVTVPPYAQHILYCKYMEMLADYGKNIALQGEFIGETIQGNHYEMEGYDWKIYDVFLIDEYRFATPAERRDILKDLNLRPKAVPFLEWKRLDGQTVESLMKYANGKSRLNKKKKREGVVFKSTKLHNNDVVSFKVISPNYEIGS